MNSVMNEIVQIEKELGFEEEDVLELDEILISDFKIVNRPEWTWVEKSTLYKIGSYKTKLEEVKRRYIQQSILINGR